jgi:uncharacterized membrane protein YphA (DoxX/SURF4 family)
VILETFADTRVRSSYWALRVTFGLVPLLAGLDKFTHVLANWDRYLSPAFARMIPLSASGFMRIVGVIEIVAGLLVLTKFTRIGAYLVMAWLICIAVNLVSMGVLDVAVRDLALAVGAYALARLEEVRSGVPARTHVRATVPTAA